MYQWWRVYEEGSPADVASLTWTRFLELFLRDFVPQTLRNAWRVEFEYLRQGNMTLSKYAIRFSDLSRHTPTLVSLVREWVHRFIEGLIYGIRFNMARDLETDTPYQQVVEIARRLEGMRGREREDREAKKPRGTGGFNGGYVAATARHGRGYAIRPVHSALPASSGAPVVQRSQGSHFAQPLSSEPPARGTFSGQSSRLGPSQS
ncbi:uncharacterized protein [Nicotiana tomentosiformis]|uniref:uncharacterized protein n=1 Tax=Nicotiana tomentosiformis TaxID=4098 RepID=UPI00388C68E0